MASNPFLIVALVAGVAACGARSEIGAPEPGGEVAVPDAAAEKDCGIECTIGHACCAGGCDGPAVPVLNDCCPCQPGDVSSTMCGNTCGGSP